jgi:hypothetical protein
VITYVDVLRELEPINEQRDKSERISYDSLWIHAKRHYDFRAVAAYQMAQMLKELLKPLGSSKVPTKLTQ